MTGVIRVKASEVTSPINKKSEGNKEGKKRTRREGRLRRRDQTIGSAAKARRQKLGRRRTAKANSRRVSGCVYERNDGRNFGETGEGQYERYVRARRPRNKED